jgi:uncharacterized protein (TIGR02569 family)
VLAAFGVGGCPAIPVAGGQGTSWRSGDLVFKPTGAGAGTETSPGAGTWKGAGAGVGADELAWLAEVSPGITGDGFRLAQPIAARDGSLSFGGWCASRYEAGQPEPRRWAEIIAVGARFHAALRTTPRPAFLDRRSNPWAISDRVAWGEQPAGAYPGVSCLPELIAALRPLSVPGQLIHGDLSGNVLFHDQLPPAIIDFTPYWRPAGYAAAVVVADALVCEGADASLLDAVSDVEHFGQYLVRALIFRRLTDWIRGSDQSAGISEAGVRWSFAAEIACNLASQP